MRWRHASLDVRHGDFGYFPPRAQAPPALTERRLLSGVTTIEAFAYARDSLRLWDLFCQHVATAFDARPTLHWLLPWKATPAHPAS